MNPFDQFAGELTAALPPSSSSSSQPAGDALVTTSPFGTTMMPSQFQHQQQPPPQLQQPPPPPATMNSHGLTNYYGNAPLSQGGRTMQPPQPMTQSVDQYGGRMTAAPMASGALVPSATPSHPYGLSWGGPPPAQIAQGPPQPPLLAGPVPPPQLQGLPPQQQALTSPPAGYGAMNPFGAPSMSTTSAPMNYAPPPRAALAMDPFAPSSTAPPASDPWSSVSAPPAMLASDPWGEPSASSALVPSTAANDDPFGIFGASPPPSQPSQPPSFVSPPTTAPQPPQPAPPNDDPWADLGFGAAPAPSTAASEEPFLLQDEGDLFDGGIGAAAARAQREAAAASPKPPSNAPAAPSKHHAESRTKSDLPPGGEWYDAKIFTPTLGVMFFKPKELVDSLFLQTEKSTVEALKDRPVVAFIVEGSSARSAGVELGHVLLKVNGIDVKNPKEASRLIKEGPRPLPLLFYVPDAKVVVAEGEHMVKYNTKETSAPNSAKDWKPKYVVIGGIIAQPWMMNMYRSKSEYDIAVIETQARRPISVKVKQFSLQGARIQNDWQGPQMVKYKNKLHPWKYIVVLPVSRNPIKIASPNLSQLKPVHEGIRRVLNAQQSRSGGQASVQPIPRDPYRGSERRREEEYDGRGGGYNGRESGF